MHTQSLSIAGYHIFLQSELQIGLEPGYIPFACSDINRQVDVVITCINNIPPSILKKKSFFLKPVIHSKSIFRFLMKVRSITK